MPNIGPLELAILVIPALWILPCYLVAKYAEGKGQSFAAFMIIGLIVGWIFTGVVALVLRERTLPRPDEPSVDQGQGKDST